MAVRKLKPVTPGQRNKIISAFDTITSTTPEKSLLQASEKIGRKECYRQKDNEVHRRRS